MGEGQEKGGEEAIEVGGENAATQEGKHIGVKMFEAKREGFEKWETDPKDDSARYKYLKGSVIRNI